MSLSLFLSVLCLLLFVSVAVSIWYIQFLKKQIKSFEHSVKKPEPFSSKYLQQIINLIPEMVYVINQDGIILLTNHVWPESIGLHPEDLIGKNSKDFLSESLFVSAMIEDDLENIHSDTEIFDEKSFTDIDGNKHWIQRTKIPFRIDQKHKCLFGISHNITDIKIAEKQIHRNEEKFKQFAEQTILGILIFQHQRLIFLNKAITNLTGYEFEDFENSPGSSYLLQMIHPDDLPLVTEQANKKSIGEKEGIIPRYEIRVVTKYGKVMWVELFSRQVMIDGIVTNLVHITDIDQRKKSESENQYFYQELQSQNHQLEQIIYAASHDLRSPLVNIQGFSGELKDSAKNLYTQIEESDLDSQQKKVLLAHIGEDFFSSIRYILNSTGKIDRLLKGLLKYSRLGRAALRSQILNMKDLVSASAVNFEYKLSKINGTIEIADLAPAMGDSIQIDQVVSNMIENAIKYRLPERELLIKIESKQLGNKIRYCIEDNGQGIDKKFQQRIFKIFHQLHPNQSDGEGLGLALVQKIIDRHGGKIWVESIPGQGSRFYFTLPAA